ncbi:unnamed protein product [Arabis nemorensis]|uniref:Uncharacterized protein n=1 Tax=Arabis nemorensis TaxID=586526 RepID=A0A565B3P3_9BRAS|nr:unnamed protein product [Arabis nemorensis]
MEDDGGERSSFVAGLIENRTKEVRYVRFSFPFAGLRSASCSLTVSVLAMAISGIDVQILSQGCCSHSIFVVMFDFDLNFSGQVGTAAFDLRSASLHLSQYIETSSSYQNTKTLLRFYDPCVIIVPLGRVIQNLAAKEPVALGLDTYYKEHYLSLAAAAATIKWCLHPQLFCLFQYIIIISLDSGGKGCGSHQPLTDSFALIVLPMFSVENLEIIDPFHNALLGTSNKKRSLFQMFKTTKTVGGVGEVIDDDVLHAWVPFVARTQQCFALKAGIDGFLDIARRTFCDTSEGEPRMFVLFLMPNSIFMSEATNMLVVVMGPNM